MCLVAQRDVGSMSLCAGVEEAGWCWGSEFALFTHLFCARLPLCVVVLHLHREVRLNRALHLCRLSLSGACRFLGCLIRGRARSDRRLCCVCVYVHRYEQRLPGVTVKRVLLCFLAVG